MRAQYVRMQSINPQVCLRGDCNRPRYGVLAANARRWLRWLSWLRPVRLQPGVAAHIRLSMTTPHPIAMAAVRCRAPAARMRGAAVPPTCACSHGPDSVEQPAAMLQGSIRRRGLSRGIAHSSQDVTGRTVSQWRKGDRPAHGNGHDR